MPVARKQRPTKLCKISELDLAGKNIKNLRNIFVIFVKIPEGKGHGRARKNPAREPLKSKSPEKCDNFSASARSAERGLDHKGGGGGEGWGEGYFGWTSTVSSRTKNVLLYDSISRGVVWSPEAYSRGSERILAGSERILAGSGRILAGSARFLVILL